MTEQPRIGSFEAGAPAAPHVIAYAEWGDEGRARTVVCAHGLTRNGRDFDALGRDLAARLGCRVICPDAPGRGRSAWLPDPALYAYPQYIADMASLLARLGPARVDWIGTSMGGLIGMFLAALPNTPIRSLVMNDIGPVLRREALERIAGYVGRDESFADLDALKAHLKRIHAPFGPLTEAQWDHLTRHGHRLRPDGRYALHYDPAIGSNVRAGVKDWEFWESWDRIACPVLVLRGAQSDLLDTQTAREMTRRGPKAELVTFPGVGHAPALMAHEQIEIVREWLARHG